jgi:hypothetical protein
MSDAGVAREGGCRCGQVRFRVTEFAEYEGLTMAYAEKVAQA